MDMEIYIFLMDFFSLFFSCLLKLIEYCFDHQIFVILKLSRKYIMDIFLAAVVNQSSHLTSISAASLWKTYWLSDAFFFSQKLFSIYILVN